MSRRTTAHTSNEQSLPTEVLTAVATAGEQADSRAPEPATGELPATSASTGRGRPPAGLRRPALLLAVAVAGGLMVNVVAFGQPDAQATATDEPVSIATQLGLTASESDVPVTGGELTERLGELAANRSQREAEQVAAAQTQAAADQAAIDAKAAEEARLAAEAKAAEDARLAAEAKAAEEAEAAEQAAAAAAAAAAPRSSSPSSSASSSASSAAASGSYQEYAMAQLGGDASEFSCLEALWGKESGWNPDAQNPTSTAYGIPQFLDSTWKGTGIAKTSDGYRQIDAGLIYIDSRYGSPCGAWSHSKSTGWY